MATANSFKEAVTKSNESKGNTENKKAETPKSLTPKKQVETLLEAFKPQIEKALPNTISAERMARIALSLVNADQRMTEVVFKNKTSFLGALMQAAQLGLEPNTNLGHAYIIPYNNKKTGVSYCSIQIGYKGLLELAYRSGQYQKIFSMPVYKEDKFNFEYGTDEYLRHQPADIHKGEPIGYYAMYKLTNGGQHFVYWSRQRMVAHMQEYTRASNVWENNFDAMAMKTTIKDLLKYAPKSVEMTNAVASDDSSFKFDKEGEIIDVTDYSSEVQK